jgi:hypothetical protein
MCDHLDEELLQSLERALLISEGLHLYGFD